MIRRLAAIYPRWWRVRYGTEFDALLADQRWTPAVLLDLLLGALDAHLTGEANVSTAVSRWRTPGGVTLVVGGLLWFVGPAAWRWPLSSVVPSTSFAYPWNLAVPIVPEAIGELLVAFGVASLALSTRQRVLVGLGCLAAIGLALDATNDIVFIAEWLHPNVQRAVPGFRLWLLASLVVAAALVAQAAFAAMAVRSGVGSRPALAFVSLAAFVCMWQGYVAEPLWSGGTIGTILPFSDRLPWQAFALFRDLLPLGWLLVGVSCLASGMKRSLLGLRRRRAEGNVSC